MRAYIRQRPPGWFQPVSALLILWGSMGCAALYAHIAFGPAINPHASEWDRAYYASLPLWFNFVYAAAVLGGLFGSVALAMRSRAAKPFFILSLAAVIVQFGYVFLGTDLIAEKGVAATVPFPLFVAGMAAFQLWFARYARRRGWIA